MVLAMQRRPHSNFSDRREFSRCARSLCSPMFFHVSPPSRLLYTPSPKLTLRWDWFSPVPSQITLDTLGSIVTQPSEYEPYESKIGRNDVPWFVVFHNPPDAAATYHTLLSRGSTAMSAIRPVVRLGP